MLRIAWKLTMHRERRQAPFYAAMSWKMRGEQAGRRNTAYRGRCFASEVFAGKLSTSRRRPAKTYRFIPSEGLLAFHSERMGRQPTRRGGTMPPAK